MSGPKWSACSLAPAEQRSEPSQSQKCSIPFRLAIILPTFAMIFVSSVAFVALAFFSHQAQESTLAGWRSSNNDTLNKWRDAVVAAQNFAVKERARLVERKVLVETTEPPDQAVDTLLGAVNYGHQKRGWNFAGANEKEELRQVEARAWEALGNQWNCKFAGSQMCSGRTDSLYASMQSGGFTGAAFGLFNGQVQPRLLTKVANEDLEIWPANSLTGDREGPHVVRTGYEPFTQPAYYLQANVNTNNRRKAWTQLHLMRPWVKASESPNYYRKESSVGVWGGFCECPNGQIYQVGDNYDNCATLACEGGRALTCSATGIISQNAHRKVTCDAFTNQSALTEVLAMSRTAPISLNGEFSGVVGADVSMQPVSHVLFEQWSELKRGIVKSWDFLINAETSNIFIVQQLSPLFPEQVGTLIGTSQEGWFNSYGGAITRASESPLPLVASVSQAILARYNGSWDADALLDAGDEVFYFSLEAINAGNFVSCHPLEGQTYTKDCIQVATHSMSLDESVRWLVVVALPSQAYFTSYNMQVRQTTAGIDEAHVVADSTLNTTNIVCIFIIVVATLIAVLVGAVTSCLVLRPLERLGVLMERLSHLDFAQESTEFKMLHRGVRGRVREVNVLREGFCRLSNSIETFSKFVPDTVVRSLVCADEHKRRRAAHLHVDRRNVTIMFSDVADFTTISEKLPQKQLLFLLTLYLTVMTRIVESFEGVVGEVLGDGLLCFWNTPDTVTDHAAKATMASLAQQHALIPLNAELQKRGLPQLAIRIGLHTGDVFTGNIGSEQKMKFGCMGDPVNLASRLEGLNKVYGTGIMISGATYDAIPDEFGFVTRRLDLVQVKGKNEPTQIFELVGCHRPEAGISPVSSRQIRQALLYEEALDAYQRANFAECVKLAESLQALQPEDLAVKRLLGRAKHYVDSPLHNSSSSIDLDHWTGVEKMLDK